MSAITGRLRVFTQPMTLRVKLGLMMLIPLLALLLLAAGAVNDERSDRDAASEMRQQAQLSLLTGQLVHELQRERGLSGISVNAGGAMDSSLLKQQAETSTVFVLLAAKLGELSGPEDLRFTAARASIEARWERIGEHRLLVRDRALDAAAAMRPYTGLIDELLTLNTQASIVSGGTTLLNDAHWDFLHAKERAALIRGTLGAAAGQGFATAQQQEALALLQIEEEVYVHSFVDGAPREVLNAYWTVLADPDVLAALALRDELIVGSSTTDVPDGGQVFDSLTSHVEALLLIEQLIVDEITTTASGRETAATVELVMIGGGAAVLLVVSFVVLALGARSIARPLRQLAASAKLIADGDLEEEPSEWPDDAIGEMGTAFEQMRSYLTEMAEAAEEVAWGDFDVEVEPRSAADTFGHSIAAMTRRLSLMMVESEVRAEELEGMLERLRKSEEELRQTATHDGLTGLPNRAHFMERLEVELERARRAGSEVGVAFIDLNKFKAVNDTLGHHAGDTLLEMVAERLRTEIRAGDTAARLGGDEFALILPDLHKTPAPDQMLTRLVEALSVPYELHDKEVDCPPSMGVAFSPADAQGADLLLAKADQAMYAAKRQGGGAYRFWTATDPQQGIAV